MSRILPLVCACLLLVCAPPAPERVRTNTFKRLAGIRSARRNQVESYFSRIRSLALDAPLDPVISTQFHAFAAGTVSVQAEFTLDRHFVMEYGEFYDMLFVAPDGNVFHSIKKEADYGTNLITDSTAAGYLAARFKRDRGYTFTDFDYYHPSQEPAAFFIISVQQDTAFSGWIVLQCPLGRVNRIFTASRSGLGRTGEAYLVNHRHLMLSNSRFTEDSSILRLRVETEAVRQAFTDGYGERIINDYRGIRVYSSYEKFNCFGSEWVIIAEIDEDEVLTDYYRKHGRRHFSNIGPLLPIPASPPPQTVIKPVKRVDMNEFAFTDTGGVLATRGVGTCTGLAMANSGSFAYLAHIGPADRIYGNGPVERLLLKEKNTSYLTDLLTRIRHYRVLPAELRKMHFHIVATHLRSYRGIIKELTGAGVELAQITFHYGAEFDCANIHYDQSSDRLSIEWIKNGPDAATVWEMGNRRPNLARVLKKAAGWGG